MVVVCVGAGPWCPSDPTNRCDCRQSVDTIRLLLKVLRTAVIARCNIMYLDELRYSGRIFLAVSSSKKARLARRPRLYALHYFYWGAATISAWRAPGCAARHENARCRGRVEVPGHARCMWTYGVYVTVCAGCAATHAWRNSTKWHGRLLRLQHGSQPRGHVHVRCCAGAWVDRQRDIFRCDDGVTDQR